jgi:hypothetical protein
MAQGVGRAGQVKREKVKSAVQSLLAFIHMNRLLDIGFEPAGHWLLKDGELVLELSNHSSQRNILYAFVSDGQVKYRKPGRSQTTNINNHERIKKLLRDGAVVEILALPDNGLLYYGQFHLNLAAGLEDNIIRRIDPEWNGGKRSQELESINEDKQQPQPIRSFTLILQPTYLKKGFFNISVANAGCFGADGQKIEIFCGSAEQPVLGFINRTANINKTPRIMGGPALRDWFEKNMSLKQKITVTVISPTAIRVNAGECR